MPGVQNPHWLPPVANSASDHRSRSSSANPSTVVITRPAMRRTGVTHATRGAPSTNTVQHPHCPWGLQPAFGARTPSRPRNAANNDTPLSGTLTSSPSTTKEICAGSEETGSVMTSRSVIGKWALRDDDRPKAVVDQRAGTTSAERVTAAAGLLRVGVVDRETGTLEAVFVIEGGAGEELGA